MGSCVSSSANRNSTNDSMKLRFSFGSRTDKLLITPANEDLAVHPVNSYGSRDETFFDSQAWLESDCEDDYFSVNGDFTPSRGNTPVHHSFSTNTPKVNRTITDKPAFEQPQSPTDKKKKLSEIFRDEDLYDDYSQSSKNVIDIEKINKSTKLDIPPKSSVSGTPYLSGATSMCTSERTANEDYTIGEKPMRSSQCCFLGLLSCRSFSKRKKMNPAIVL